MKNKKSQILGYIAIIIQLALPLHAEESKTLHFDFPTAEKLEENISVNFTDTSLLEFLRFVSKVAGVNFIYDEKMLDFNISLVSGKPTHPKHMLKVLTDLLNLQGIKVEKKGEYFLVDKMDEAELSQFRGPKVLKTEILPVNNQKNLEKEIIPFHEYQKSKGEFYIYKVQYHQGLEIQDAIKNIALDLRSYPESSSDLAKTIGSMQWVQSTNSILYSGSEEGINQLTTLLKSLDVPKKQVFIEVLVIETDVKSGLEFGLEWAGGGQYKDKLGFGTGSFPALGPSCFANTMQQINATNTPTGLDQTPIGRGFDLSVIGDIILHKGKSYLSLGSLVSALQVEGDTTIILNQKIITQDNKLSSIFVGDNIPFTGSVIQIVGASQQTSSNIEYRDVGVKLNITPLLGDGDIITLDIAEEITEARDDIFHSVANANGIITTKTDMATQVHVPDKSFLVLSGMIRNTKKHRKSGLPCLGGLPMIGAAFSKTKTDDEKRNVIIFVRPQIIHSQDNYRNITIVQEDQFKQNSGNPEDFQSGIDLIKKEEITYGINYPESRNSKTCLTPGNTNES